jgi:hypothetical protein
MLGAESSQAERRNVAMQIKLKEKPVMLEFFVGRDLDRVELSPPTLRTFSL